MPAPTSKLSVFPKTLIMAHIAILVANVIWGVASPVIKLTLQYIPPYTFLFLRFLIVCAVLLPFAIVVVQREKVNVKDYFNLFVLGLFAQTAIILVFLGLSYTTALDSTIIGISASVMAVYAGHYFYKEKVDIKLKMGLLLASLGTFVVILEPIFMGITENIPVDKRILGNFFSFLYNISWVIYIIWSKLSMGERSAMLKKTLSFMHIRPMTKKYTPELIITTGFYVGLATMIPFAFLEQAGFLGQFSIDFNIRTIPIQGILGLLYMAFFSSIVAYIAHQWGMENSRVSDIAIYGYLAPILAVPASFLLLGELPNVYMIIGGILIAIGVVIAESRRS